MKGPVLTVSYFDDDILEMNVYSNGECLTGHRWSSPYTDYELEDKVADISVLSELFGHQHVSKLLELLELDDLEEAVRICESIIGLPLWIDSNWFDDMDEAYREKYIPYDLNP